MKDVIVVGGGVIGLFCAVRLRKGGARVRMMDSGPEHPTYYTPIASAAAAGMLAPIGDAPSAHERVALESFELWKFFREGAEWADGVRFDGAVVVRENEQDASAFAANAARLGHRAATLTSNEFRKRTGFRAKVEHALFVENEGTADPLRVLTGLLPICTHCRKVRDDAGYWRSLETYVASHSTAVFSHSLCEPCLRQHYGHIFDDEG